MIDVNVPIVALSIVVNRIYIETSLYVKIALIALIFTVAGCLGVPWYESEPYKEDAVRAVVPYKTNRKEIVHLFGEPEVTRNADDLWIYYDVRKFFIFGAGTSDLHGYGDHQFIVVEFEDDTVISFELVEDVSDCSSSRVCVRPIKKQGSVSEISDGIVFSKGSDDEKAKIFNVEPEMCRLYVYPETSTLELYINNDLSSGVPIDGKTFFHQSLQPGIYEITTVLTATHKEPSSTKQVECKRGSLRFLSVRRDFQYLHNRFVVEIEAVNESEGIPEILDRNLVLLP